MRHLFLRITKPRRHEDKKTEKSFFSSLLVPSYLRGFVMRCPHCEKEVTQAEEFCPHCRRILPVSGEVSHYTVLGYDRDILNIDLVDLEKRFFELSKKFHPDRFANKTSLEIQLSHDRSSAVNNAYRALKNPVTRAKYLVEREMGSIEEKSAKVPSDIADTFF